MFISMSLVGWCWQSVSVCCFFCWWWWCYIIQPMLFFGTRTSAWWHKQEQWRWFLAIFFLPLLVNFRFTPFSDRQVQSPHHHDYARLSLSIATATRKFSLFSFDVAQKEKDRQANKHISPPSSPPPPTQHWFNYTLLNYWPSCIQHTQHSTPPPPQSPTTC